MSESSLEQADTLIFK